VLPAFLVLRNQRFQQLFNQDVLLAVVAQRQFRVYTVYVSAPTLAPFNVACVLQIRDYFMGSPLSYANILGDFPRGAAGMVRDIAKD